VIFSVPGELLASKVNDFRQESEDLRTSAKIFLKIFEDSVIIILAKINDLISIAFPKKLSPSFAQNL